MTANRMVIFAALCAAAAPLAAQDEGKNVYDVQFHSNSKLDEYPWLTHGKDFRTCLPYTSFKEYVMQNAYFIQKIEGKKAAEAARQH